MSSDLRVQIRNRMALKESEELLEIWQNNHRFEWSDDAFEVIKDILKERGVETPVQNEPVYEVKEETVDDEISNDDGLDKWEAKALDDENQPEFYDPLEVITLKDNVNKTAKAVIIIYTLSSLVAIPYYSSLVRSYFPNQEGPIVLIYLIAFIIVALVNIVTIAVTYFPLKALAYILRILMEMEFSSRKGKQSNLLVE